MMKEVDNQYVIIEKAIIDVESKVQMAEFTKVLKDSNDLIKELNVAAQME